MAGNTVWVAVSWTADIENETGINLWLDEAERTSGRDMYTQSVIYTPGSGIPLFNSCYIEIWLLAFNTLKELQGSNF